jgi:preprotein translocase SecE subunit
MAEDEPKKKRRVKNPETFRERALKAGEETQKSKAKRPSRAKKAGSGAAKGAARPLRKIGRTKPARLIGKVVFPSYFRNSLRELKLVTWPGWKQSRQLTFAVLVFAVIFGASIAVVDYGLDKIFRNILLK